METGDNEMVALIQCNVPMNHSPFTPIRQYTIQIIIHQSVNYDDADIHLCRHNGMSTCMSTLW